MDTLKIAKRFCSRTGAYTDDMYFDNGRVYATNAEIACSLPSPNGQTGQPKNFPIDRIKSLASQPGPAAGMIKLSGPRPKSMEYPWGILDLGRGWFYQSSYDQGFVTWPVETTGSGQIVFNSHYLWKLPKQPLFVYIQENMVKFIPHDDPDSWYLIMQMGQADKYRADYKEAIA